MSALRFGILADDLTGAADSVAPFARLGFQSLVGFQRGGKPRFPLSGGAALAYDIRTRDEPADRPNRIATVTRAATRRLQSLDPELIYKKIDSTLRGHLRLELDAMRRELPERMALICPAFPESGRVVRGGILQVHGTPWDRSEFAPAHPLPAPTVRGAFGYSNDATAAELGLADLAEGADGLLARLTALWESGVRVVFCDAADPDDLRTLALASLSCADRCLPVGSAGLAAAFAGLMRQERTAPAVPDDVAFTRGRTLIVIGSRHAASRKQAAVLAARTRLAPVILERDAAGRFDPDAAAARLSAQIESGQRLLMLMSPDTAESGWSGLYLAKALIPLRRLLTQPPELSLIAVGGDTARFLGDALFGLGLEIGGETEPGIAIGRLVGDPTHPIGQRSHGLPIITKAGGFGDPETLVRCVGLA